MKRFFIHAVLVIVTLAIVDFGVGQLFKAMDNRLISYPIDYHNSYIKTIGGGNSEDMIIIGHSRARHHYIPSMMEDSLGISVVNAGKDGTGFLSQAVLVQGLVSNHPPKFILWEVRPDIFHVTSTNELDRLTDLMPFYDLDSLAREWVNRRSDNERYKMLSFTYRNNGRFWGLMEQLLLGRNDNGLQGYVPVKSGIKQPNMNHYDYDDAYNSERAELFVTVANSAKNAGTKLIMAVSPQYEISNTYQLRETQRFFTLTDSLNVPVLDFFYNEEFLEHPEWFKDRTHLNDDGAQRYMEVFIPELRKVIDYAD